MKALAVAVIAGSIQTAAADDPTLCWASCNLANALVELSKDFEAEWPQDEFRVCGQISLIEC